MFLFSDADDWVCLHLQKVFLFNSIIYFYHSGVKPFVKIV